MSSVCATTTIANTSTGRMSRVKANARNAALKLPRSPTCATSVGFRSVAVACRIGFEVVGMARNLRCEVRMFGGVR